MTSNMMTIKEVEKMAKETMLKQGGHNPQLIICGENGNGISVFADMPSDQGERMKMFGMAGIKIALEGKLGQLQKLYFISEAWLSRINKNSKKPFVPPSKDPNKMECLIVASHDISNNHGEMLVLEIKRDKKGNFSSLKDKTPKKEGKGEAKSILLEAFIKGYEIATLKIGTMKMEQGLKAIKQVIN